MTDSTADETSGHQQRPCGEVRKAHSGHQYMLGARVYDCPGGQPSCDSHEPSVDAHDASVDPTDTADGRRAQYAAAISREWDLHEQVVAEIVTAVMAVADRELNRLRLQLDLTKSAANHAAETLKHRAEQAEAAVARVRQYADGMGLMQGAGVIHALDGTTPGPAATQATEDEPKEQP